MMKHNTQYSILNTRMLTLLISMVYGVLSIGYCLAQPVSSAELIAGAKQYDGKTVVYQGEAIGDVMPRGGFAWVNVFDGKNAIGCWVARGLTKDIRLTGSYGARGDEVEITGVLNHVCLVHGGDLDIHGESLRIIAQGETYLEQPSQKKIYLALLLLGVLCLVLIWSRLKRRPGKK